MRAGSPAHEEEDMAEERQDIVQVVVFGHNGEEVVSCGG